MLLALEYRQDVDDGAGDFGEDGRVVVGWMSTGRTIRGL